MKSLSQLLSAQPIKGSLAGITTRTDEKTEKELQSNQFKTFSSADLWNIQRKRRMILVR